MSNPQLKAEIRHGDCVALMRELPDNSIDSIVTDPPYGLEFMGKEWDAPWKHKGTIVKDPSKVGGFQDGAGGNPYSRSRIAYGFGGSASHGFQLWFTEVATEFLRVLKPGGHLLAFGGTRTYHRLAVAIEDAGFEIRDSMMWLYGSGFPKSHDVSKAIDKAAGAERERVPYTGGIASGSGNYGGGGEVHTGTKVGDIPATDSAKQWHGWGTALKPAHEPIVVARKPLIGTVAENVLEWGVGAMNIDGCRINGNVPIRAQPLLRPNGKDSGHALGSGVGRNGQMSSAPNGRWPANVVLSHTIFCEQIGETSETVTINTFDNGAKPFGNAVGEPYTSRASEIITAVWNCADGCPVAELDRQSGVSRSAVGYRGSLSSMGSHEGWKRDAHKGFNGLRGHNDIGGASRFFYVAKANKRERPNVDGVAHPTVKPLALMRWLVRLVTPAGGTVLEPFAGSGTTVEAALLEGCSVLAFEKTADYLPLIRERIRRTDTGVNA